MFPPPTPLESSNKVRDGSQETQMTFCGQDTENR